MLWDHGGGSKTGLFIDEVYSGDVMRLDELGQAFRDGGVRFETVLFDACMMANLETAYLIHENANWMVASEELVAGKGTAIDAWPQQLMLMPECDGKQLGRWICDMTQIKYANDDNESAQQLMTWSVIDLSNDGALTVIGAQPDGARVEDIPVLRLYMTELSVLSAAAMLLAMLLAVWLDACLSRERKRAMIVIAALVFSLMLQNYVEYRLSLVSGTSALRIPSSVFGYAVRPAILAMFLYIVRPGRRYAFAWALIGVNAAVYLTAFFSPIAFSFNKNGHFIPAP